MGERLVLDIKERDDVSHVKLSGIIDEDNGLAEALGQATRPVVVINTADVERINSCGVRDWVTWLSRMEQDGADLYFVDCSPTLMTQVNLVNNFLGAGSIINFYAPYFCASCDTDKMLLIDVGEAQAASPFTAPTCRCDQCDHTMEFDDIESSYFAFLGTVKKISPTPALLEQISQISAEGRPKLRSRASSATIPPVNTRGRSPSSTGRPVVPTTPGGRELRSLLTDNLSFDAGRKPPPAPAVSVHQQDPLRDHRPAHGGDHPPELRGPGRTLRQARAPALFRGDLRGQREDAQGGDRSAWAPARR